MDLENNSLSTSFHAVFKTNYSILAKAWYRGTPPRCSTAKIINYVVANKAGPILVATWRDPTASRLPVMHQRAKRSGTTASEENAPPAKSKHRLGTTWIGELPFRATCIVCNYYRQRNQCKKSWCRVVLWDPPLPHPQGSCLWASMATSQASPLFCK